jgi:hypothetical protein
MEKIIKRLRDETRPMRDVKEPLRVCFSIGYIAGFKPDVGRGNLEEEE